MKNLSVLISERFFLGLASLRKSRQNISHSISFSLIIIDLEVVLIELWGPTNQLRAQTFYIHESTQVIIVSKDKVFVFVAFLVVVPSFESLNNGQELMIMGFVPCFYRNYLPREKSH